MHLIFATLKADVHHASLGPTQKINKNNK